MDQPSHAVGDYHGSLQRSHDSRTRADRPAEFHLAGRQWTLLGEVFAPVYSPSSQTFLDLLDFPVGGTVLEIGSGAGVIAVSAALAGCAQVVATDISPEAVRNTRLNAARHGVADRVRCQVSDMFAALDPHEHFDLVFWHSNFVHAPETLDHLDYHDLAYVDPGYRAHRAYLAEAPHRLRPGGDALLGFSSRGDMDLLRRLAAETGVELAHLARRPVPETTHVVDYQLLRLTQGPHPEQGEDTA
ncbi:methyltransferase domain-containing protein [Streptomyces sp. NPDC057702]|uniref:methyltransferase domain-containing protein n=1 Tax=unclassified Streptomyces TaxID=2593676 RepID=UPI003699EACD